MKQRQYSLAVDNIANDYCMMVMGNNYGRAYTFGYLAGKHIMQEN